MLSSQNLYYLSNLQAQLE